MTTVAIICAIITTLSAATTGALCVYYYKHLKNKK